MDVSNLLVEGVQLMLLGMGSVFLFLTVLVLAMSGVSRLVISYADDSHYEPQQQQPLATPTGKESEEFIAVISAAISRYRNRP